MRTLKLFEYFTLEDHLRDRGIDPQKTKVIISEDDTYFFLYNLSGQIIGYHKYNPNYPKSTKVDPRLAKYFTWVTEEDKSRKIAVWGLESFDIMNDKFLFITEGVFDCARVHQSGYPGIAVLCNDPSDQLKNWLYTLPQKKIVIYDNDTPGKKLIKVGDFAYSVSVGKDLNDLTPEDAKSFLDDCLISSGFEI